MDSVRQQFVYSDIGGIAICFNPCFNGFSPSTYNVAIESHGQKAVSILVLMDSVRQLPLLRSSNFCSSVSILVLMDSVRQPYPELRYDIDSLLSFNPCFNGFSPSTMRTCKFMVWSPVSILVLMDSVRQPNDENAIKAKLQVSILVLMDSVRQRRSLD